MPMNNSPERIQFGLLPEPEGRSASFIVSAVINGTVVVLLLIAGMFAKQTVKHVYEETALIFPNTPPPPPVKIKLPKVFKMPPAPKVAIVKLQAPRIVMPKPLRKPKPVMMRAKLTVPRFKTAKPQVIMQPQPKAAMTAAMMSQVRLKHPSTAPVHLGSLFGVRPDPRVTRPATVAALGNPYGGMQGRAEEPHGVVGSAGIGNGVRRGSNAGVVGRVASAGFPGAAVSGNAGRYGKVASVGMPSTTRGGLVRQSSSAPAYTRLKVLSKPPVHYTALARERKIQGQVILRVTFMADGQVVVQRLIHGLGFGLDQEAMREAKEIKFVPATRNGHPIDLTTNIVITFQLA